MSLLSDLYYLERDPSVENLKAVRARLQEYLAKHLISIEIYDRMLMYIEELEVKE